MVTELTHNKAGQAASIHSHSPGRGRVQPRRNHWHMGCRSADCASGSVTANERGPVTWTANVVTGRRGGATWELGGGEGEEEQEEKTDGQSDVEATVTTHQPHQRLARASHV